MTADSLFVADRRVHLRRSRNAEGQVHRRAGRPVRTAVHHDMQGASGGGRRRAGVRRDGFQGERHSAAVRAAVGRHQAAQGEKRARLRDRHCSQHQGTSE